MRQSVGGAWLFSISITLMMFIIAYVAISIDYSNAYQLKNDVSLIIEQYNGLNAKSASKIVGRMHTRKFATNIDCSKYYDTSTYYEGKEDNGDPAPYYYVLNDYTKSDAVKNFERNDKSNRGYICIYKYLKIKKDETYGDDATQAKAFYAVTTSFGFNFPIIGNIFNYRVTGETNTINYPADGDGFDFGK